MSRKYLFIAILCNVIWGLASIYWHMLAHIDSVFVLCNRVLFAAIFSLIFVFFQKKGPLLKKTFCSWKSMKYLIPAGISTAFNWWLYIWAMGHERMLDASLGYFMGPLIVFAFSILVFKEKSNGLKSLAIFIAVAGVFVSLIMYQTVPFIGLALGLMFTFYGILKKFVKLDPVVSICVETLIVTPFVIAIMVFYMRDSIQALTPIEIPLLIGTGLISAVPLILYSSAVNNLPYIAVGFTQYISPAITVFVGLFYGEVFTPEKTVLLAFILVSIALYFLGIFLESRKPKEVKIDVSSIDS